MAVAKKPSKPAAKTTTAKGKASSPREKNAEAAAILAELKKDNATVQDALHTKATDGFATNEEIIDLLGLKPGSAKIVKARCIGVRVGKTTKTPVSTYFSFNYAVLSGPGKGLVVSRYIGLVARGERTKADAYKDVSFEMQRLGYDMSDVTATDLLDFAETITEEKPGAMLKVKCYKVKAGPNKGKIGVDIAASRPLTEDELDTSEDEEEEEVEEEEEEDSDEEEDEVEEEEESEEDAEESEDEDDTEGPSLDDPASLVDWEVIAKPAGTPRKATYTVSEYVPKTKKLTLLDAKGKSYSVKINEILSIVEED